MPGDPGPSGKDPSFPLRVLQQLYFSNKEWMPLLKAEVRAVGSKSDYLWLS